MTRYFVVEFTAPDAVAFDRFRGVFEALKQDKDSDKFRPDDQWPELFDREALDCFNWWTDEDRARWLPGIPDFELSHQAGRPRLEWEFFSMIEAFKNGDYQLIACQRNDNGQSRLEYDPFGGPYGGSGCMVALIQCFGFVVSGGTDVAGFPSGMRGAAPGQRRWTSILGGADHPIVWRRPSE
ncbi:hypothetical protein Pan44_47520 [Caulifigura coniformis]|uniref:Uncharacterized protein n=1 Tax=Caulifigura coniformis TaxID=2527983 RepID=A0A517SKP2_9PLAN|nr:hypothetical protein [Caulifigura coniformis]QDT56695.1 hypothetical protein Pan44_47520 [Caulifigura coniformis]